MQNAEHSKHGRFELTQQKLDERIGRPLILLNYTTVPVSRATYKFNCDNLVKTERPMYLDMFYNNIDRGL